MIYSMTGFGKAIVELPHRKITVEIKSLNSKQLDLSTRIPQIYKELEMDIRSEIARQLERGKVDFSIQIENKNNADSNAGFNVDIIKSYYTQLQSLTQSLQIPEPADWLQTLLRLPDALKSDVVEVSEEESQAVKKAVDEAIAHLIEFRAQEGLMLQKLFTEKIGNIARLLAEVEPYEKERTEKIKARIIEALKKIENFDYDKNRMEQEMIFYIEKLDINEEKNRLDNHLRYFIETMEGRYGQGKKLGFISQEIGREVNTMGSKANHAELQKIVVRMKDELEQIKEQILNVM
ncbi:MAG TPA: YicC family protein [Candidatus Caccoplasma merdavium]|nr:YicC family protein [Candidatus Caccoplasma merdavium]